MKLSVRYALIAAAVYMLFELVIMITGYNHHRDKFIYAIGFNTLLLLLAVAFSILVNFNRNRTKEGLSLMVDLKQGMATAGIYAVVVAGFMTFFFAVIDPEYAEIRAQHTMEMYESEEEFKLLVEEYEANPENFQGESPDDIREKNLDNAKHIYQPGTVFPMALFALFVIGMIYAFAVTAFNRIILAKL